MLLRKSTLAKKYSIARIALNISISISSCTKLHIQTLRFKHTSPISAQRHSIIMSQTVNASSSAADSSNFTNSDSLPTVEYVPRFIDVGINLTDRMYQGYYHGRKHHDPDLNDVIERGKRTGCERMMVTGSDLHESEQAVKLAEDNSGLIYATVGIHPCSSSKAEKDPKGADDHLARLEELVRIGKERGLVTAFGEIGLDYDRFSLSEKEPQLKWFDLQLKLAEKLDMPLFLHSRAAEEDFERMLLSHNVPRKGLVHSFTGNVEEMKKIVKAGYDIGINGCSLKTEENLAVVKEVPLEHLQLETDGPWCEIRPSHASSKYLKTMPESFTKSAVGDKRKEKFEKGFRVKGRNEPCAISQVAWVVSQVKGVPVEEVCEISYQNSMRMFKFDEAAEKRAAWEASKSS